MTYNLNTPLLDYDNKEIMEKNTDDSGEHAITYKEILRLGLNVTNPQDPIAPDQKALAFDITVKAYAHPDAAEFTAEEVSYILARVKANFPAITVGRCIEFFNQKAPDASAN